MSSTPPKLLQAMPIAGGRRRTEGMYRKVEMEVKKLAATAPAAAAEAATTKARATTKAEASPPPPPPPTRKRAEGEAAEVVLPEQNQALR